MSVSSDLKFISRTLGFKILMILVLGLLLLIPMSFIKWLVKDRKNYQTEAVESIVEPMGGSLKLEGILIAVPYISFKQVNNEIVRKREYIITMPETYNIDGNIEVNVLKRGIFKVPVFNSPVKIDGYFKAYDKTLYNINERDILWNEAVLVFGVSNKKNFTKLPVVKIKGKDLSIYEKALDVPIEFFDSALFFKLPAEYARGNFNFDSLVSVQGGNSVELLPLASENTFTLSSKWTDPSFTGGYLPVKREVTKNGFAAKWEIASFNTAFNKSWTTENTLNYKKGSDTSSPYYDSEYMNGKNSSDTVTTSFLMLNDNYRKTSRSLKYMLLFIFIPFFTMFLCEVLAKKILHPVQYCLIGMANVIFYLLLLSISEHLSFNMSYLVSAAMVMSITALYSGYIMKSVKLGFAVAIVQVLVYVFLFGILQLTDYALLMGTIGLFIAIAAAMFFTRNIDWFNNSAKDNQ